MKKRIKVKGWFERKDKTTIKIEKLSEHDRQELLAMIDLALIKCNNALQKFAH